MAYLILSDSHEIQESPFALSSESRERYAEYRDYVANEYLKVRLWKGFLAGVIVPAPKTIYNMRPDILRGEDYHHFMKSECGCVVSQTIVDIIEELEPNIHQFFPVKIVTDEGAVECPYKYYILNVGPRLKVLDIERGVADGELHRKDFREEHWPYIMAKYRVAITNVHFQKLSEEKVFSKKNATKSHAVWAEYGCNPGGFFVSDEFSKRVNEVGGFGAYKPGLRVGEV